MIVKYKINFSDSVSDSATQIANLILKDPKDVVDMRGLFGIPTGFYSQIFVILNQNGIDVNVIEFLFDRDYAKQQYLISLNAFNKRND
jgi:hypothetical protein